MQMQMQMQMHGYARKGSVDGRSDHSKKTAETEIGIKQHKAAQSCARVMTATRFSNNCAANYTNSTAVMQRDLLIQ